MYHFSRQDASLTIEGQILNTPSVPYQTKWSFGTWHEHVYFVSLTRNLKQNFQYEHSGLFCVLSKLGGIVFQELVVSRPHEFGLTTYKN